MTTTPTPTPTPDAAPEPGSALPPPSRYDRIRTELVSGGTETPRRDEDVEVGGTPAGRAAAAGIVGLFIWLGFVNPWMLLFAAGIIVSVFLHETGHFVTARLTGMKATQFFLGFGPRLWSFRRGETEYGVRLLPLGAFVKILGMTRMDEVPIEDEARTYRQKSYPRRMLVITAGSLMHMLIAVLLLFAVFVTKGRPDTMDGAEVGANPSGAALEAGIRTDDIIVAIDGVPIEGPDDMGTAIRTHQPGDSIAVALLRDGNEMTVDAVLGRNPDPASPNYGTAFLGVGSSTVSVWSEVSVTEAATSSVTEVIPVAWQSTKGVFTVLNPINIWDQLTNEDAPIESRPSTVVGATQVSGSLGDAVGVAGVLYLLAALNVFIGVFNLFPLLPLDGGHAAIATYERVREGRNGRRYFADVERLMPLAMGVIVLLLTLFMSGLYLDIVRPIG